MTLSTETNTDSAKAIFDLGMTLLNQGRFEEAAKQFDRALEINPQHIDAMINLGNTLRIFSLNADAKKCYYRALELQPNSALAYNNLGLILQQEKEMANAVTCFQRAIALATDYAEAYNNLGSIYLLFNMFAEAGECFKRTLTLLPDSPVVLCNLGSALQGLRQLEDALQCYGKAQQADPNFALAYCNMAVVYSYLGRDDEAKQMMNKAVALDPHNARILATAMTLIWYEDDAPFLNQLESVYARRAELSVLDRIPICMTFGHAMEKRGEVDQAFQAYQEGNLLSSQERPFDETGFNRMTATIRAVVTKEKWQNFTAAAATLPDYDDQRVPIFIVGMPRSGSTLIEQILTCHPLVGGTGESSLLQDVFVARAVQLIEHSNDMGATLIELRKLGTELMDTMWQSQEPIRPDARYVTDKMLGNIYFVGLIKLMLPNAKIIHTVRDPLDTCFSSYALQFAVGHEFTYDLEILGRYFKNCQGFMQYWTEILPENSVLEMQYEKNVGDLESEVRRMLNYLELPWDPACLNFHKNKRIVTTASSVQVRQPLFSSSVQRWKPFEKHLQPLIRILQS